jgi:hypothetical protein
MEILQFGGRLYIPPEDESRVMVPQLMRADDFHFTEEEIEGSIGGTLGRNPEEGRQVIVRDLSSRMAQRDAGTPRPGGGRSAGLAHGHATVDRTASGGSRRERVHHQGGVSHPERPTAS